MLRTLITETYGGKIDDDGDFALLTHLVSSIMTPAAYEIGHKLVESTPGAAAAGEDEGGDDGEGDGGLAVPSGTGYREYMEWVARLPEREPPTYLGLPANAEKLLLVSSGRGMIENLGRITEMLDEGEQLMAEAA